MNETIKRWYSLKEIIEYLGVIRDNLMKWIETKNMLATKASRLWKFNVSEIDKWM